MIVGISKSWYFIRCEMRYDALEQTNDLKCEKYKRNNKTYFQILLKVQQIFKMAQTKRRIEGKGEKSGARCFCIASVGDHWN